MNWQYTPYVLPSLLAAVISVVLAFLAWRRRSVPGAMPFAWLMLALAKYSLAYGLELASSCWAIRLFWLKAQYLGIVSVPLAWLVFALDYTGHRRWLSRRTLALLALVPLATFLLACTNEAHSLIWRDIQWEVGGPFPLLDLTYGTWWRVHVVYSYLLMLVGTLLFFQTYLRSSRLYRRQAGFLLIGGLIPWVGNALYVFKLNPFPNLDLTPFAFILAGLIVAWALFRLRLLDLVPMAREVVFEDMLDGVIVLDVQNRIVDLNPAAERILGHSASEIAGQAAARFFSNWPNLLQLSRDAAQVPDQIVLNEGEQQLTYDLRLSPLHDRQKRLTGFLIIMRDITRRVEAEEALHETEGQYRLLIETTRDGIALLDMDGRIVYVNQAGLDLAGLERSEALDRSFFDFVPAEHQASVAAWWAERAAAEPISGYEIEFLNSVGQRIPVEVNSTPVLREDRVSGILVVARDITERIRSEQELLESERQKSLILDSASEMVAYYDTDLRVIWANRAAGESVGKSSEELVGLHCYEIWYQQDEPCPDCPVLKARDEKIPCQGEKQTPDGKHWSLHGYPVLDQEGQVVGLVEFGLDITERKQMEEALRKSEERFRKAFDTELVAAAISRRRDGMYLEVNPGFLKITGYSYDEIVGHTSQDLGFLSPSQRQTLISKFNEQGDLHVQELVLPRKNGELRTVLFSMGPIDWGDVACLLTTTVDITERVRAEETLRESEEKYRLLAEHSADVIYRLNIEKEEYTYISPSVETVFGYAPEEVLSLKPRDILTPESYRKQLKIMQRDLSGGWASSRTLQLEAIHREGHTFPVEVHAAFIPGENGQPGEIQGVVRDITERALAEQALAENEAKLSALIENTDGSIWSVDREYRFIVGNSVFHRNVLAMRGCPFEPGENVLIGESDSSAEVLEQWRGYYDRALRGEQFSVETRRQLVDTSRYMEYRFNPIHIADGTVTGVTVFGRDVTERVLMEKALRESEEKYYRLFSEMLTGCALHEIICDEAGHPVDYVTLEVNQAFERILGARAKEVIGRRVSTILPEEELERWLEIFGPVALDGESTHYRVYSPVNQKHFEGTAYSPAPGQFATTFSDITERVQAGQALRTSEERFRLTTRAGNTGVWDWNLETDEIYLHPFLKEMLGYEDHEIRGHMDDWGEHVHPKDVEKISAAAEAALEGTMPEFYVEHRMLHKDGSVRWFLARGQVMRDATGRPYRVIGTDTDITERVQAEQAIQVSEEKYRALYENAPLSYQSLDGEGYILDVNPAWMRTLGYRREKVIGRRLEDFLHPDSVPRFEEVFREFKEAGQVYNVEFKIRHQKGHYLDVAFEGRVGYWPDGSFRQTYCVFQDITDRKRAEEALRQRSRELALLNHAGQVLNSILDLDRVLVAVLDEMRHLLDVIASSVWLFDPGTGELVCRQSAGPQNEAVLGWRLPAEKGIAGWVARTGESLIVPDAPADERYFPDVAQEIGLSLRSILCVPLHVKDRVIGVLQLLDTEPDRFTDSDLMLAESLAAPAASAIENSRLYEQARQEIIERERAQEALRLSLQETARGERMVLALGRAAQAVQRALTSDEVYRTIGDGLTTIGFQASILTLIDDRAHLSISYTTHRPALLGEAEKMIGFSLVGHQFPLLPGGFFERCVVQRETIFSEDGRQNLSEVLPDSLEPLAERLLSLLDAEKSLVAPLTIGDEAIGVLAVTGVDLRESDMSAITAFANQASIALENARLVSEVRTRSRDLEELSARLFRAQEEERRRLSLELHDELGQELTALGFDLAAIERELPPEMDPKVRERLDSASSLLARVDEQVSNMALDLRPQMLDDLGLLPTLRWYVKRFTRRTDIDVELKALDVEERLPPQEITTIYRTVQEALTNVAKHAGASRAVVRLERRESAVIVVVRDNGRGFEVEGLADAPLRDHGAGLLGIRERVALLEGDLDIESRLGEGTQLMIKLPV